VDLSSFGITLKHYKPEDFVLNKILVWRVGISVNLESLDI